MVFPGISLFQNVGKGWEERPEAVLPNGRQVSICKGTLPGASLQDTLLEGTLKPPWLSTVFLIPSLLQHLPQCWRFPCGPLLHLPPTPCTPQMSHVSDPGGAERAWSSCASGRHEGKGGRKLSGVVSLGPHVLFLDLELGCQSWPCLSLTPKRVPWEST